MSQTNTSNAQPLDSATSKRLKAIGHELKPVVQVGNNGISPSLLEEVNRALDDHELIKIKIPAGDKQQRCDTATAIANACDATVVQAVGRMVLLLRKNPQANPKLSNLARH